MLAKTCGATLFGVVNAFVPVLIASFMIDFFRVVREVFVPAVFLISVSSTFLGFFIAVVPGEVFEAQTFSIFFAAYLLLFPLDLWGRHALRSYPWGEYDAIFYEFRHPYRILYRFVHGVLIKYLKTLDRMILWKSWTKNGCR